MIFTSLDKDIVTVKCCRNDLSLKRPVVSQHLVP